MWANYGEPLRKFLKQKQLVKLVDFGDLPVFQNTTTYPCILVAVNLDQPKFFDACNVETLEMADLKGYLETLQFKVDPGHLQDRGWMLAGERQHRLMEKIKTAGRPLGEYVEGKIFYGIKTGLNEAFVIDEATRERLIGEDPGSVELIKPFLLGRDVKRYEILKEEKFLILIPRGWTRQHIKKDTDAWGWFSKHYPALAAHLGPYKEKAEKRCDKGQFWWELRSCDYYEEFEKSKIIYPNICQRPEFTFDEGGLYTNQKCFIIPVYDKYLLGILNSKLSFFIFRQVLPKLRGDFFEPGYKYMKDIPIPRMDLSDGKSKARYEGLSALVEEMFELQRRYQEAGENREKERYRGEIEEMDGRIDQMVYGLYGLTGEEIALVKKEIGRK
jgi:hypothetical protein